MNKEEARKILAEYIEKYCNKTYADILSLLKDQDRYEVKGKSGQFYQLVIDALWDDKSSGHVRVMGAVDDGGLRAYFPLTDDFIVEPNGNFAGE